MNHLRVSLRILLGFGAVLLLLAAVGMSGSPRVRPHVGPPRRLR